MESTSGKLDPDYLLNPTSLPSDAGDEVFAYDADGRRFETRDAEETRRSVIDHRDPTGYSQKLDEIKRDAGVVGGVANDWRCIEAVSWADVGTGAERGGARRSCPSARGVARWGQHDRCRRAEYV